MTSEVLETGRLLDQLIERLPVLREQGVTHVSVDPASGAVSLILGPKPPPPDDAQAGEQKPARPYDDGSTYSLPPGTPMPPTFRERLQTAQAAGQEVK